jgi:hypothetical protein
MHPDVSAILGFLALEISILGAMFYTNSRVDRLADKLDKINEAIGDHGARIKAIEDAPGKVVLSR